MKTIFKYGVHYIFSCLILFKPFTVHSQTDTLQSTIKIQNLGLSINSALNEFAPVIRSSDCFFFSKTNSSEIKFPEVEKGIYLSHPDSLLENGVRYSMSDEKRKEFAKFSKQDAIVYAQENDSVIYSVSNNHIYYSVLKNGKWADLKNLSSEIKLKIYKNNFSVTPDGKTIYFSSKHKQGYGGYDIYSAALSSNGKWTIPQNLGHFINTANDEFCPEISRDGKTLYFSSNGHKGIGGFDIYKTYFINQYWTVPVNMESPINSSANEIFMKISADGQYALYSSNRDGGYGGYDIYKISTSGLVSKLSGNNNSNSATIDNKKDNISSDFPYVVTSMANSTINNTTNSIVNCFPYQNKDFIVTFDASRSIDSAGKKVQIEWVFPDGKKKTGFRTEHSFKTPGKHLVTLNVIDPVTNKMEMEEAIQEINIAGMDYVGFLCPDTILASDIVVFDGSYSYITGKKIIKYAWKVGNISSDTNSSKLTTTITAEGECKVEMVIYTDDKLNYCASKTVFIKTK